MATKDLTDTLMAQDNAESAKVTAMHKAIKQLLAEFTPAELEEWRKIESDANRHHRQSGKALDDIDTIRSSDPETYINRLHATLERSQEESKRLADEMKALVDRHFARKRQSL